MNPVLDIRNLTLSFKGLNSLTHILQGISLKVMKGERVALVGESGSGKSVTARIILGLIQDMTNAKIGGEVIFDSKNISISRHQKHALLRGTEISMIFQDPTSSLNPAFTIGFQFSEILRRRNKAMSKQDCNSHAHKLLADVSIPDPARVLSSYSFQLSGGINQRVMIAMALANSPKLLLADEPGTALDVSVQAQTLKLMREMTINHQTAVLFISHNLGVVREFAERVYVIYHGRIVEDGPTQSIFSNPRHPYTQALMSAVPRITENHLPDIPETSEMFFAPQTSHPSLP